MFYTLIKWFLTRLWLVSLLLILSLSISLSQIEQPDRFELELGKGNYEVVSANDDGLFIIISSIDFSTLEKSWNVIKLDTSFNVQWQREYSVTKKQSLVKQYYDNGKLFFLFARTEVKNRNLELLSFNASDGFAESFEIKNFIPISFFDFKIADSKIIIGGYFNARPLVILYDLYESIPVILPGLFGDRSELVQIVINENETFELVLSGRNFNKQATLFLNTYSLEGDLLESSQIKTEIKKDLLFGMITKSPTREKLVAGIYGRYYSEYSKGLFIAKINGAQEQSLKYYNYGDLKNFFNYMKAKRQQRVRKRIERRRIKDKKLRFNYRLMVHDIVQQGDQVVLMGEAFYPKYRTVGNGYRGNGRVVESSTNGFTVTNRVFEGYQYTHAVVIGFNDNGELLWDNSFEINDVLTFNLKQYVQVNIEDDRIVLLYVFDDLIRSKVISENEVLIEKEFTPIKMKFDSDRVVDNATKIAGIESWYGDVFYTYGTQTIKNLRVSGVELNREVFFINKVIYK